MKNAKALGALLTALMIMGILWNAYAKPAKWDQNVLDTAALKVSVATDHDSVIELKADMKNVKENTGEILRLLRPHK